MAISFHLTTDQYQYIKLKCGACVGLTSDNGVVVEALVDGVRLAAVGERQGVAGERQHVVVR